ncbi:MAG: Topoisomerase IV subunit B (EC [uncultured Aureispira sp.]|uniref:DNA topoisomerase (ATP-hydrolyzing) n=1 Tax=uncultured Aureispira sp. TaxID=1331704 RepID=A0A6S6T7E2_9BACT|nr:MAG: Topoisomerase IV subunit B (EC [uncultured Aureispira sp.]
MAKKATYTEDNIRSLDWKEHIRLRPGMYIGKLGNGTAPDDGIYILFKEVIDNSIDEYMMGAGKKIEIKLTDDGMMTLRDYGRGIPLGKVVDCVSKINTGGKYDSNAFQKAVGLNGVGTKAVNALSTYFKVCSYREGKMKTAVFGQGILQEDNKLVKTDETNGTYIEFRPDSSIFKNYKYNRQYIEDRIWDYAYLNAGLRLTFNSKSFVSKNGLLDLLTKRVDLEKIRYPIIHLKGDDIELAMTHGNHYGEQYSSFVNGQNTTQGGTHLNAFRAAFVKTIRDFYGKNYDASDIRSAVVAAISVRVQEPIFESQTKTKLGSINVGPQGPSINVFVADFIKEKLDNYLHKNPEVASALQKRIVQSERERKEIAGIKKLANTRAKKANLHNKKLRDCRLHYNTNKEGANETMLFITEGDSASGSITKARDVQTQAVFSLRGKPLNCYNLSKKVVYENEEFNLLQHALNIEDGLDDLRYNKVIVATDADVDGMHIRLLLLTFFLQFFPELVIGGHLYILETPLFRVRNKKKTFYCYSEVEKQNAMDKLGKTAEVTRFKGLGEISPSEFGQFIGEDIHLEPVQMSPSADIEKLLSYYMGKNTPSRQQDIIENLRVELDAVVEN